MFLDNKYTRIYNNIISQARQRKTPPLYFEKHHVIPRSLGGSNSADNIVKLTYKEHFICHILLPKMLEGAAKGKMYYALCKFKVKNKEQEKVFNSSRYEFYKIKYKNSLKGVNNHRYGVKLSEETKKKISESNKGRRCSTETRQKMALAKIGKPSPRKGVVVSEETRRLQSEAKRKYYASGKPHPRWGTICINNDKESCSLGDTNR